MTEEKVITKLVNELIEYAYDREDYLEATFLNGFKGFNNYTIKELETEYYEVFGKKIKVKK